MDEGILRMLDSSIVRRLHQIGCTDFKDGASRKSAGWQGCGLWLVDFRLKDDDTAQKMSTKIVFLWKKGCILHVACRLEFGKFFNSYPDITR